MAPEWSVRFEAEGSLTGDEISDVLEKLAPYGGVGSPGDERVSVRLTVEADFPMNAYSTAWTRALEAGFPAGRVVAVEIGEVEE
jgi:hypothetical protein